MISLSYVKGEMPIPLLFDGYRNLILEFDRIIDEVNEAKYVYEAAYADYLLNKEFLESDDDNGVVAAKQNFFEKIGAAIIAMFKKGADFINGIVEKIKAATFKNKSDLDKLAQLQKKYPEEAEDIKIAVENGWLDLKSAASLKELETAYSSLMRLNSASEASEIERKWNEAKRKFRESAPDIIQAGAVVGSILTIAGVATSLSKAHNSAVQAAHNMSVEEAKIYKTLRDRNGLKDKNGNDLVNDDNKITANDSLARMKLKITQEYIGINTGNASLAQKISFAIRKKIVDATDSFIDRKPTTGEINDAKEKTKADNYRNLMDAKARELGRH